MNYLVMMNLGRRAIHFDLATDPVRSIKRAPLLPTVTNGLTKLHLAT
jgi:hypothetical protein